MRNLELFEDASRVYFPKIVNMVSQFKRETKVKLGGGNKESRLMALQEEIC